MTDGGPDFTRWLDMDSEEAVEKRPVSTPESSKPVAPEPTPPPKARKAGGVQKKQKEIAPAEDNPYREFTRGPHSHPIGFTVDKELERSIYEKLGMLRNAAEHPHTNDFFFFVDVVRAAMGEHLVNGEPVTEIDLPGPKRSTTIDVNDALYGPIMAINQRARRVVMEKILRTFVKNRIDR